MEPNMIGAYGPWAASIVGDALREAFVPEAGVRRSRGLEAGRPPAASATACSHRRAVVCPRPTCNTSSSTTGAHVEHLHSAASLRSPHRSDLPQAEGATERLPAVLAAHDHGGNKAFGTRKIAQISDDLHPVMKKHRDYYGGLSWANELAKRGYAVLVHDAFAFASRRIRVGDLPRVVRKDLKEENPESEPEIAAYNKLPVSMNP